MTESPPRRPPLSPDVAELYRHINGTMLVDYTNFVSQSQAKNTLLTWPALLPQTPDTPEKA